MTVLNLTRRHTLRAAAAVTLFATATVDLVYGPLRLEYPAPVYLLRLSGAVDTLILVATYYAAVGLLSGKRAAWRAALAIMLLAGVWMTVEAKESVSPLSLFPAVSVIVLIAARRYFRYPSRLPADTRSLILPGIFVVGSTLCTAAAYAVIGFIQKGHIAPPADFVVLLSRIYEARPVMMFHGGGASAFFLKTVAPLAGIVNYLVIAVALLRPVSDGYRRTRSADGRARRLLEMYSTFSEDYFKVFPADKSYFFGRSVEGFIAYGTYNGVCVALADPIAASASDRCRLLREFLAFCDSKGWQTVFLPIGPDMKELYEAERLKLIQIGENAVVRLGGSMRASRAKRLRNVENRFVKAGYGAGFVDPCNGSVMRQLRTVSDRWLTRDGRKERQFAMGYFDDGYLRAGRVYALYGPDMTIHAFVNLQPNYTNGVSASFDLIRADPDVMANATDYLLICLIRELEREGWRSLDLGLVPLAGLTASAMVSEKVLNLFFAHTDRWFSFRGLYRFKRKFDPDWEPRFLAYSGSTIRMPMVYRAIAELMRYKV